MKKKHVVLRITFTLLHRFCVSGPEYGTTEAAWKSTLVEAERVADMHLAVKDKLVGEVQTDIKAWKAENYHKPMVGPYKETKALEDEFRKVRAESTSWCVLLRCCRFSSFLSCVMPNSDIHPVN